MICSDDETKESGGGDSNTTGVFAQFFLITQNGIRNTILIVHKGVGKPGESTWTTSYPLRWIVKQREKRVAPYVGTTGTLDFPSCWGALPFSCPWGFLPKGETTNYSLRVLMFK
jgi:hypothetical protein